jgi:uncharacterized protein YcbX
MQVNELWRYPVKSLRGERLQRAQLGDQGVHGDRVVRIVNDGRRVSARTVPRLLGLEATLGDDGEPLIDGVGWRTAAALEAVQQHAGIGAELIRDDTVHRFDAAPILLTTDGALEALGEDRRRFRPNLVVTGVEGLAERDWVGKRLRAGSAELLAIQSCERCLVTTIDPDSLEIEPRILIRVRDEFDALMGVYCQVVVPGEIVEGDAVELVDGAVR